MKNREDGWHNYSEIKCESIHANRWSGRERERGRETDRQSHRHREAERDGERKKGCFERIIRE